VEKELMKLLRFMDDETSYLPMKKLEKVESEDLISAVKKLIAERNSLKKEIVKIAKQGDDLVKNCGLEVDDFYYKSTGPYSFFEKIVQNPDEPKACYMNTAREKGSITGKNATLPDEFYRLFFEYDASVTALLKNYKLLSIFTKNLDAFLLLFDLKKIAEQLNRYLNVVYISDSNKLIHDHIKDEDSPYLYEKLGNRYSTYLIDEFQDTSKMQWDNLLPLVKNAISGIDPFGLAGKSILFGDVKQAIYRFRNGDSSLFNRLTTQEGYLEAMKRDYTANEEFENISLHTNYRSSHAIISFNNLFFDFLTALEDKGKKNFVLAEDYYQDVQQDLPSYPVREGLVTIRFKPQENSDLTDEYMQKELLHEIRAALRRGFSYRDIMILVKSNQKREQYARFLMSQNIPVVSGDSLTLHSSPEVRVVLATMKYTVNQDDSIAKLTILYHLLKQNPDKISLQEALEKQSDHREFHRLLTLFHIPINLKKLSALPLFTLFKELMILYGFDRQPNAFLTEFADVLFDYVQRYKGQTAAFLAWWEENAQNAKLSSRADIDAVGLMSIHQSKGLQFPVVIFPFSEYSSKRTKDKFWFEDREQITDIPVFPVNVNKNLDGTFLENKRMEEDEMTALDNLNVLYVAHTRPQECLHIITGSNSKNYGKFLKQFVENHDDILQYAENEDIFFFGDRNYTHTKKDRTTTPDLPLNCFHTSGFLPENRELLFSFFNETTKEQKYGIAVHDFLSSLHVFPQSQSKIDAMTMDMEDKEMMKALMMKALNNEELRPHFSDEASIFTETSIVDADGMLYRPDRISMIHDEVLVVDYKTGKENPKDEKQLNHYVQLLQEMGYQNVKGKLLYIEKPL
jgi:ATP-dependent exoDNAse (exonuclease V) beta subunit